MSTREQQAEVNRAVVEMLCKFMPEMVAREVVRALAKGLIPCVKILYPEESK